MLQDPRTARRVGLRLRPPSGTPDRAPLILHSPGLGSGLANGAPWCEAWQQAGFWVATLSHPVTNDDLWDIARGPFRDRMAAALAPAQYPARVRDLRFVLDTLLANESLAPGIDRRRIGVAGHSYGALTVQALAGQQGHAQQEPRISAFVALSPSAMSRASAQRMAAVTSPFMCVIGSHDQQVTFSEGPERIRLGVPLAQRLWIHEQVPSRVRALLQVDQADHMTLAGEPVDATRFSRDVVVKPDEQAAAWQRIAQGTTTFFQNALG